MVGNDQEKWRAWLVSRHQLKRGRRREHNMVGQWFEASVEDLGQLEIFDLPPALNVHVEVTAGELKEYKEK